ncbi:MAG: hypothetical protein V4644_00290 [Patescibacteria group bacterium]
MPELYLQLLFFASLSDKEAERYCKKLSRSKRIRAKKLMVDSTLTNDHIRCFVSVRKSEMEKAAKMLPKIGARIKLITGIDEVIVQIAGHSEYKYNTTVAA